MSTPSFPASDLAAPALRVGAVHAPFDDVSSIAVLRGGGLGDLIFTLPALLALRAAYPGATLTLLGAPSHAALLAGHPELVDRVVELPVTPGIRDASGLSHDPAGVAAFQQRMRAEGFDLAAQLHGGGRNSNPFLAALGARHTIGTRTPDAIELERTIPYIYYQHEVLRYLEVAGLAGATPVVLEPVFTPTDEELLLGERFTGSDAPLLAIHPGATDPRRRWPAGRFAEVAARACADGARVVVIGDRSDVPAAEEIAGRAREVGARVESWAGRLTLPELVGLFTACTALLANDSGPRHLAQAIGVPTVGVFWFGNVINAGPFERTRQRVHISWITRCPVCGRDATQVGWTAERCEHDVSFVADVAPAPVYADVADLMARTAPRSGR